MGTPCSPGLQHSACEGPPAAEHGNDDDVLAQGVWPGSRQGRCKCSTYLFCVKLFPRPSLAMNSLRRLVARSVWSVAQPGPSTQLLAPWMGSGVQPCSACARAALVAGASRAAGLDWTHTQRRGFASPVALHAAAAEAEEEPERAHEQAASGYERPNKNRKHLRRMLKRQKQIRVRLLVLQSRAVRVYEMTVSAGRCASLVQVQQGSQLCLAHWRSVPTPKLLFSST